MSDVGSPKPWYRQPHHALFKNKEGIFRAHLKIVARMDIKEFAQEFIDNVKMSVEMTGNDYDQELALFALKIVEKAKESGFEE